MKKIKNVQSSNLKFIQKEFNVDTVYIRTNETSWYDKETQEQIGWIYDEIQYTYKEYIELIETKNEKLGQEITDRYINEIKLAQHISDLELQMLGGK